MIAFPGHIFDADGRSIDQTFPDLTQDTLDSHEHRSMVTREGVAPVAQAWVLADDATFAAVPQAIVDVAIEMVQAGKGIIILAKRAEPLADVRDGLLDALRLADVDLGELPRA